MSSRAVIEAVMAEVAVDVPAVTFTVGQREAEAHGAPPRVEWVPIEGDFEGPQKSGYNPRPLQARWTRWAVKCWGADFDATEQLLCAVVRALHLTLTTGGYRMEGEAWATPGMVTQGDAVTLGVHLGTPVLDRPQPTAGAPAPGLAVNGTVTPP